MNERSNDRCIKINSAKLKFSSLALYLPVSLFNKIIYSKYSK